VGKQDYEGEYIKVEPDPTIWLVEGGERIRLETMADWWWHGLRPMNKVTARELAEIPLAGEDVGVVGDDRADEPEELSEVEPG